MYVEFLYEDKPIYELTPIYCFEEGIIQLEEITKRFIAMRKWCIENHTIMTTKHMKNVLRCSRDSYYNYSKGVVQETKDGKKTKVNAEKSTKLTDEEKMFHLARKELLCEWIDYCEQWVLDDCASRGTPGSLYISKSVFGNWDTPQEKKQQNFSIELFYKDERAKLKSQEKPQLAEPISVVMNETKEEEHEGTR